MERGSVQKHLPGFLLMDYAARCGNTLVLPYTYNERKACIGLSNYMMATPSKAYCCCTNIAHRLNARNVH